MILVDVRRTILEADVVGPFLVKVWGYCEEAANENGDSSDKSVIECHKKSRDKLNKECHEHRWMPM